VKQVRKITTGGKETWRLLNKKKSITTDGQKDKIKSVAKSGVRAVH
jgi:hypothetical protein